MRADDEHHAGREQQPERLGVVVEHLVELVDLRRHRHRDEEPDEHRRAAERRRRLRVHARAGIGDRADARRSAHRERPNATTADVDAGNASCDRREPRDDSQVRSLATTRSLRSLGRVGRSVVGYGRELGAEVGGLGADVGGDVRRRRPCAAPARSAPRSRASRGSPMPAVVTAAVPRRRPLVTNGFSGSFGIAFLLQVIPARSSASCATLPVTPNGRRSTSMRWLSVPPETMRKPSAASASASAAALRTMSAA